MEPCTFLWRHGGKLKAEVKSSKLGMLLHQWLKTSGRNGAQVDTSFLNTKMNMIDLTKLPPGPVSPRIGLGGKPKWLPLSLRHDPP